MKYQPPVINTVAMSARVICSGSHKGNKNCNDSGAGKSSTGSYEVDE
jgi:hypothetical protein